MSCWTVLGIIPTKNIDKIKKAYVELSNSMDKNSTEFEEIKLAYNKALSLANTTISDLNIYSLGNSNYDVLSALINSSISNETIDSVEKFIDKVNEIYTNPLLRFNKEHWINLLTLPILNNTALNLSLENELIKYLYDHKYLPINIYKLLDSRFNWTSREKELKANIDILNYFSDTI